MDNRPITERLRDPNADECSYEAADYIERLEAVVIALDDAMRYATAEEIEAVLDVERGLVWGKLVAARARVTLPPSPTSDGAGEGGGNGKA